jgi:hypothetical protein
MSDKKILDGDPSDTDGSWVVILSLIEEWLRVTVVRTRIDEIFCTVVSPLSWWREN